MKYLLGMVAILLIGCTQVPVQYDSRLLEPCQEPTGLRGPTGADLIFWAQENGPKYADCVRIHNGLVKVIKAQQ